jgi:hypothetical protein
MSSEKYNRRNKWVIYCTFDATYLYLLLYVFYFILFLFCFIGDTNKLSRRHNKSPINYNATGCTQPTLK